MSAQSEPEKYSIDEMMDRLKHRSSEQPVEDGELVTRADGSQAIRVRKRKRRSHQPHKEEQRIARRARMIQVSGALILLLLAAFAAGAAIVYANSTPFREKLLAMIANASGAKAELRQFRMNPASANANLLTLQWPSGNVLGELSTRGIRAEIRPASFLGRGMSGEEVKSSEATLFLRVPDTTGPRTESAAAAAGPIHFKRYAASKFNVIVGAPTAPLLRLYESEASFQPEHSGGRPQLLLNRGDLVLPGWPKLRMDRAHIEFRGPDVDIVGIRFHHDTDSKGEFELAGTVSPYQADRPSSLAVNLASFPVAGIAGPELGKWFNGRIDTVSSAKSNYLTFTPGPEPDAVLAVDFRSTLAHNFEVSGFPFLIGLAQILDDEWFERPVFDSEVTGTLRRTGGNTALGNLSLESKGRLSIRGSLTRSKDNRLSGTFEIGLPETMIKSSRNRRLDAMFLPGDDGLRWLNLDVTGSGAQPGDNFKQLYEAAALPPASDSGRNPSFDDLTRPRD